MANCPSARVLLEAEDDPYTPPDPYAAGDPYAGGQEPKPEPPKPARLSGKGLLMRLLEPRPDNPYWKLIARFKDRLTRRIKIGNNTWAEFHGNRSRLADPDNFVAVTLHQTVIARLKADGSGSYYNGGWNTRTTADRINKYAVGGWRIYTFKGEWFWWNYIHRTAGDLADFRQPFTDGDSVDALGELHATADPIQIRRRRRRPPEVQAESMGGKAGVYADLTGPKPLYYAKCPECGHVHGMYPSFAAAQAKQVCGTCQFEKVMKYKSDLEKMGRPKKKRPVREAFNVKKHVLQGLDNWVARAQADLSVHIGEPVNLVSPEDLDDDDLEFTEMVYVRSQSGGVYYVYKNSDVVRDEVKDEIKRRLHEEPQDFPDAFLERFCDEDALRWHVGMDFPEIRDVANPFTYLYHALNKKIQDHLDIAGFDYDSAVHELYVHEGPARFMSSDNREIELDGGALAYRRS